MISLFLHRQKKAVALAMRRLYHRQLTTASGGNVSIRNLNYLIITPSQVDKSTLSSRAIAIMNMEGELLTQKHKPSMESEMHRLIYKTRSDIRAIVHAHPPFATAFTAEASLLNTKITGEAYLILGEIGFAPYQIMGSVNLAETIANIAKTHNIIFLQHHGVVTLGKNLNEAFDRMDVVESVAKTTIARKLIGVDATISNTEIEKIKLRFGML